MPIVLITGTSTGIGLETALVFARKGYPWGRGAHAGVVRGIAASVTDGLPIVPIALDVESDESVREALANRPGGCAGQQRGNRFRSAMELMPMPEIRAVFETNVFGAVRMMHAVLPSMRTRRQGVIVNVTSMMGRITFPGHGAYAATKFALRRSVNRWRWR